ncbi:unnamed protein product, partial [Phaeothamnion confervicola]
VWSVALSSDKRWVLSGSFDSTVRLWDLKTGSCALVLEGHSDLIRKVAWGLDQRQAISCDDNGVICHWN